MLNFKLLGTGQSITNSLTLPQMVAYNSNNSDSRHSPERAFAQALEFLELLTNSLGVWVRD